MKFVSSGSRANTLNTHPSLECPNAIDNDTPRNLINTSAMENSEAVSYLQSLLGKQLRITTTDTRMFVGTMKCTDHVTYFFIYSSHTSHTNTSRAGAKCHLSTHTRVSPSPSSFCGGRCRKIELGGKHQA